jgi:ABC-type nitrate/sulfonate/bicarbonate transport system substrate-binding protein
VITVNGNFARNHPDYVKRLLAQDVSEAIWADSHYQKTTKIIADATNQKETAILKTYPYGIFYLNPSITDSVITRLKEEGKYLNETGQVTGQIDWNTLVDTSYLDAITTN